MGYTLGRSLVYRKDNTEREKHQPFTSQFRIANYPNPCMPLRANHTRKKQQLAGRI